MHPWKGCDMLGNNAYYVRLLQRICLVFAVIFLIAIPIWFLWIAPYIKKIPDDFSYSADVLSLDNFYDEKTHKFEGEQISKTIFNYSVVGKKSDCLVIQNVFDVRTLNDNQPIFSAKRLYFIDPYTGQHVAVIGEKKRDGYLFAPRYANQQGFHYWHINYDASAPLEFVDKEKMDGLTVYHYQAHYEADQTVNLTYLPGVPKKRGVRAKVNLQLWIEPISGWLVQYQDNTLAYYYDRATGKALNPWNQFSNRYTQGSVAQQVKIAKCLKWKMLAVDFGVPIIFLMLAIALLRCLFVLSKIRDFSMPTKKSIVTAMHPILLVIIVILIIIIAIEEVYLIFFQNKPIHEFKIGISQWNDNPKFVEIVRGFKKGLEINGFQEGKNITFIEKNPNSNIEKQINIIQFFVKEKVDLIFTLTMQGTMIAKGITNQIPIVFSAVIYPQKANLIASLRSSGNNLVGTRNYIAPTRQFYLFQSVYPNTKVLGFVRRKREHGSSIQYEEYKEMLDQQHIKIIDIAAIDAEDLLQQLQSQKDKYQALYLACDTLMHNNGGKVATDFSIKNKIPSFSCEKENVQQGALMGYVVDSYSIGKLAGEKAALILQGAEPSWLHTEAPLQGQLIINATTARLLGAEIPPEVLQRANEIIGK